MTEGQVDRLVAYRLEQAQTALDDAEFLMQGSRSPQSIINRSYYAMFYAVLALLQRIGTVPSKHAGTISLFDTEFVLKEVFAKELSRDLHRAFELRQASDYRTADATSPEKARETWEKAARFVEAVRNHLRTAPGGERR